MLKRADSGWNWKIWQLWLENKEEDDNKSVQLVSNYAGMKPMCEWRNGASKTSNL